MDDFLEPHKLKCMNCCNVFMTVLPIGNIKRGDVHCPKCGGNWHGILDEPTPTSKKSSDLYDSLLYAASQYKNRAITDDAYIITAEEIRRLNNMEDENMKRTDNKEQKDQKVVITRKCDTSRGIFTVGQLEPMDTFVLIDDEYQTIYMAVYEEDPKYKTKQAVINMHNGNLLYLDLATKIHVYRDGCELRVGEFIWSSEGYNSRVEI